MVMMHSVLHSSALGRKKDAGPELCHALEISTPCVTCAADPYHAALPQVRLWQQELIR